MREHLGSADAVWIVSNIRRAINDKTAREMMPTLFRQKLVDWGRPGALSFLATASDCLVSVDQVHTSNRLLCSCIYLLHTFTLIYNYTSGM